MSDLYEYQVVAKWMQQLRDGVDKALSRLSEPTSVTVRAAGNAGCELDVKIGDRMVTLYATATARYPRQGSPMVLSNSWVQSPAGKVWGGGSVKKSVAAILKAAGVEESVVDDDIGELYEIVRNVAVGPVKHSSGQTFADLYRHWKKHQMDLMFFGSRLAPSFAILKKEARGWRENRPGFRELEQGAEDFASALRNLRVGFEKMVETTFYEDADLDEARMRDTRRHQDKAPSGAQLSKKIKDALAAVTALSAALVAAGEDRAAAAVDDVAGRLIGATKQVTS